MLNTFQNYQRNKLRQEERELHLRTIEALSAMHANDDDDYDDDNEEPSAIISSMTEGILRGPSNSRERSALGLVRAHSKRIVFAVIAFISPIIALYVSLAFYSSSARNNPPISGVMMDSRIQLMSMIQDWNVTAMEQLEDYQSPQARAMEWILSSSVMDSTIIIDSNKVNTLKEQFALATLFFTTQATLDDESWTNHDNWLSAQSMCTWYGVTCAYDGLADSERIRSLDISMNGLQSSLPAEVSLLSLESLGLHSNALTGTIPTELYRMVDLAYLYLDNNHLSGYIDSAIGNLTSLVDLRVSANMLTGELPTEIENMSLLQILYIDGNAISGMLPSKALSKMVLLHELQFHDNIVSGVLPEELARLKMLRVLYCDGNLLFGGIPNALGQLTHLEALFLFDNQISGPIPQSFSELTKLQEFQVHENELTGPIWEDVLGAWTNLQIFRVHNNSFDGSIPHALGDLNDLKTVQLHGNHFVGTVPEALCNSTELKMLTSDCYDLVECFCCTQCFHH